MYVLRITDVDGDGYTLHHSEAAAIEELAQQTDRELTDEQMQRFRSRQYIAVTDDWGRRLSLSLAPDGISTAKQYSALVRAYGARECGVETQADIDLLNQFGW